MSYHWTRLSQVTEWSTFTLQHNMVSTWQLNTLYCSADGDRRFWCRSHFILTATPLGPERPLSPGMPAGPCHTQGSTAHMNNNHHEALFQSLWRFLRTFINMMNKVLYSSQRFKHISAHAACLHDTFMIGRYRDINTITCSNNNITLSAVL